MVKSTSKQHHSASILKKHGVKEVVDHERSIEVSKSQRPDTSNSLFSMRAFDAEHDLPIVYSKNYNISMLGVELLHHFDTKKYAKMAAHLNKEFLDTPFARQRHHDERLTADEEAEDSSRQRKLRYLAPNRPVSKTELEIHHTRDFVDQVHENKAMVARITETWLLNLLPMCAIDSHLLTPIKWQVAGTIYAAHLAMQHGWAINLGGGFHQCSMDRGETFCLFSDVFLVMKYVWRKHPLQKFLIIDLDAHQAIGLEHDLNRLEARHRKMVHMMDVFNSSIQPPDLQADKAIDTRVELGRFTGDQTYLAKLEEALEKAFANFSPTLILYVAGQDVLNRDQLGLMNLSDEGLMRRDELVFSWATERKKCPIMMLLGGGYLMRGVKVQADSIRNLFAKNLIWGGHRSGSRTLSRPRKHKSDGNKGKDVVHTRSGGSAETAGTMAVDIVSKSTDTKKTTLPHRTQIIETAPVSARFLAKKLAKDDTHSKNEKP